MRDRATEVQLTGIRPDRPAPPPRKFKAWDYNTWRLDRLREEELDRFARKDAALGVCERIPFCGGRRKEGCPPARRSDIDPRDPLGQARIRLVESRVTTWAGALEMTPSQVETAIRDLDRRLEVLEEFGLRGNQDGWRPPTDLGGPQAHAGEAGRSGHVAPSGDPQGERRSERKPGPQGAT